ncbi:MAG: STAS domain-containing protein [Sphingobacteriales bacterium]|nr:STAS domain-containing protein [Sphingobacteriales bacterium]
MKFTVQEKDGIHLITVQLTEAGLNHSDEFKAFLNEHSQNEHPKLVINLAKVEYMDSSFIGALVAGLKNVLSNQGEMALACIQKDVLALFELTRLDKVFKIYNTEEEAINHLK